MLAIRARDLKLDPFITDIFIHSGYDQAATLVLRERGGKGDFIGTVNQTRLPLMAQNFQGIWPG